MLPEAAANSLLLPTVHYRHFRRWFVLDWPSFAGVLVIFLRTVITRSLCYPNSFWRMDRCRSTHNRLRTLKLIA